MSDRPIELHDEPIAGPLVEAYALQRAARLEAARQRAAEIEHLLRQPVEPPGEPVAARTLDGAPLCAVHSKSLVEHAFLTQEQLRAVWDESTIERRAREAGLRIEDVRALHGGFYDERCIMCTVVPSANKCLSCARDLHPQWPAVYCSHACALDDA